MNLLQRGLILAAGASGMFLLSHTTAHAAQSPPLTASPPAITLTALTTGPGAGVTGGAGRATGGPSTPAPSGSGINGGGWALANCPTSSGASTGTGGTSSTASPPPPASGSGSGINVGVCALADCSNGSGTSPGTGTAGHTGSTGHGSPGTGGTASSH